MKIRYIFFSLLFLLHVNLNAGIDELLLEFGQEDDLSKRTKQESLGHLTVYTRQDIERMQIRSLKDLIDYLPFLRYNEDNRGATTPFYEDFQPNHSNYLRIFLNDRELISPYYANALKLYGRMNINYVDHIEIYTGVPSYKFGIENAISVVRLYTKEPSRENTNLVGLLGGTYGTWETYGYSAQSYEDFSYLLHVNQRNIERKNLYNSGAKLERDMENTTVFTQIKAKNHRFEFQGIQGEKDDFIGDSFAATPKDNGIEYDTYSGGWYYDSDDESLHASLDFTTTTYSIYEEAYDILGLIQLPNMPFPISYSSTKYNAYEKLINAHLSKNFEFEDWNILLGTRARHKSFSVKNLEADGRALGITPTYDTDIILSTYAEGSYSIDERNILVASLKYDDYRRNSFVKNENSVGARIGYIYNTNDWTFKTYFFMGEFIPESYTIAENASQGNKNQLDKESIISLSTEFTFRHGKNKTSLVAYRMYNDDMIYYDIASSAYKNHKDKIIYDTFKIENVCQINSMDRLDTQVWMNFVKDETANTHSNYMGGYVRLLNTFGKWDLSNSLIFYGLDYTENNDGPGYNYNVAVTYKHNRNLSWFVKGSNLLGEALTTNYERRNATVSNVDVYDRTIWLGLEYQF